MKTFRTVQNQIAVAATSSKNPRIIHAITIHYVVIAKAKESSQEKSLHYVLANNSLYAIFGNKIWNSRKQHLKTHDLVKA